jgi:hypothetical protein
MTDEHNANDSIDPQSTDDGFSRRKFIRGAAASAAGTAGLGVTSEMAAAGTQKRLVVIGQGSGHHTYEIKMKDGGQISRDASVERHDTITSRGGADVLQGELWNSYKDEYTYTGEIKYVKADGSLEFELPDDAFGYKQELTVRGRGQGRHQYELATSSGNIKLVPGTTEYVDSDDGGPFSELMFNSDRVSGALRNRNQDSYTLATGAFGGGTAINRIHVKDGRLQFGTGGKPLQTTLTCQYELQIDHSNPRIAGTYSGRTTITVEFSADRSEVRIVNFPPLTTSYSTPAGQVTTTVTRIARNGRKTGTFDPSTGKIRMPLGLKFSHSTALAGSSTASFDLTTETRNEAGFNLSGDRLGQSGLALEMVGVGQFQDGFLDGNHCALKIDGTLSSSPF